MQKKLFLHEIKLQDDTHRGQMTFQQEERRRQEIRAKEEKIQVEN